VEQRRECRPISFFDGLNAIAQVGHSGHNVQMMLDTGARTVPYPSMLDAFAQWERDQLKGSSATAIAGLSAQREGDLVPII
jgi:hypothetical protein